MLNRVSVISVSNVKVAEKRKETLAGNGKQPFDNTQY